MEFEIPEIEFDGLDYEHESWKTAFATVSAYLLFLVGMFVILFVIPYLIVSAM